MYEGSSIELCLSLEEMVLRVVFTFAYWLLKFEQQR